MCCVLCVQRVVCGACGVLCADAAWGMSCAVCGVGHVVCAACSGFTQTQECQEDSGQENQDFHAPSVPAPQYALLHGVQAES